LQRCRQEQLLWLCCLQELLLLGHWSQEPPLQQCCLQELLEWQRCLQGLLLLGR
jgi:hypothetical protein